MWNKLVRWHQEFEDEQLRVLDDPSIAYAMPPGVRRALQISLAELSQVERMQIRQFSLKYRGWRFYAAVAGWFAVFSLIGFTVYLVKPAMGLTPPLVIANLTGLGAMFIFVGAWFNYRKLVEKQFLALGFIIGCPTIGGIVGATWSAVEKGRNISDVLVKIAPMLGLIVIGSLIFIAVPMAIIGGLRNRQYLLLTTQLEADAEKQRMERELNQARLRMLSAQIEPHFLFNTLGAVQQLAEQGAPRAAELTANLIAFLRASLAEMRSESVSLRADFDLIEAYLQVMKVRQGERLRYSLHLPSELSACSIPSMMLLTLVENAIKHGIEPSLRGGAITVSAGSGGDMLWIAVEDSGAGLSMTPGAGEGLDNVRKRLQLTYGPAAACVLDATADGGVCARIEIPFEQKKAA